MLILAEKFFFFFRNEKDKKKSIKKTTFYLKHSFICFVRVKKFKLITLFNVLPFFEFDKKNVKLNNEFVKKKKSCLFDWSGGSRSIEEYAYNYILKSLIINQYIIYYLTMVC